MKLTIGYSVEENRLFITVHSCRSVHDICYIFVITFVNLKHPVPTHVVNVIDLYPQSSGSLLQGRCRPLCFLHPAAWQEGYHQEENWHQEERPQPRIQREVRQTNATLMIVKEARGVWWIDVSHLSLSFCRFDFDFSLEESIQRRLDLSVKNNVSFMSRERELIGKVHIISRIWNAVGYFQTLHKFLGVDVAIMTRHQTYRNVKHHLLVFFVALSCSWTWTKLTSRLVSHNGNNNSYWAMLCINRAVPTNPCSNMTFFNII